MVESCPIGELALRLGVAVSEQDLAALRSALAETYNQCDESGGKTVVNRAIALMSARQRQWFEQAVVQIQQGA